MGLQVCAEIRREGKGNFDFDDTFFVVTNTVCSRQADEKKSLYYIRCQELYLPGESVFLSTHSEQKAQKDASEIDKKKKKKDGAQWDVRLKRLKRTSGLV